MKSEVKDALQSALASINADEDLSIGEKSAAFTVMVVAEAIVDALDRQATALERIAVTMKKIEPVD